MTANDNTRKMTTRFSISLRRLWTAPLVYQRIMASRVKRMTFQQAPQSQSATPDHAKAADSLACIIRTRWLETAGGPKPGRDPETIRCDKGHTYPSHARPRRN